MAAPTIQPGQIKTGPGVIYYKYGLTVMPTIPAPTASKVAYDWSTDAWIQVGATEEGLTYNESTSVGAIRVAESQYPVKRVTTEKESTVSFAMAHISDVNWKLACNGGTLTVTGTGATKLSVYVPPMMGAEVRVALGFHSLDEEELIIWPQCFNGGSMETSRGSLETMATLPVEFGVELPDPTVLDRPYKRWTAGSLAQGV